MYPWRFPSGWRIAQARRGGLARLYAPCPAGTGLVLLAAEAAPAGMAMQGVAVRRSRGGSSAELLQSGYRNRSCCVILAGHGPRGWTVRIGGAPADLRARGRDRGLRPAGVLDGGGGGRDGGRRALPGHAGPARRRRRRRSRRPDWTASRNSMPSRGRSGASRQRRASSSAGPSPHRW